MGMIIMNGKEYTSSPKDGFPPIIYSDEEREIGIWRDGKPLYQKSILFTAVSEGNTIPVDSNIDTFMFVPNATFTKQANSGNVVNYGFYEASNNKCQMYYERTSNSIQVRPISSSLVGPSVVTFQYTKTTDTPGSGKYTTYGGLAHHYSTTEQVVGNWIDGKPVYEKLITFSSDVMIYSGRWVNLIQLSDYNINKIIELKLYNGEYTKPLSSYMSDVGNGYLKVFVYTNWSVKSVIIQYTKTTD